MERENMLKVKARERISLRCKGGAERVWRGTQRERWETKPAGGSHEEKKAICERKSWRGEKERSVRSEKGVAT